LEIKAREKMLDLNLSLSEEIEGKIVFSDPTRLTQVLLNLLNNAIKFTEKGRVNLTVDVLSQNETDMIVRFIIEDTGIGIEPDKQQQIFEPFVQASASTNRHFGGTGLGLPIVKKVLSMFHSQMDLESTPLVGTKLFFDIDFTYEIDQTETHLKPT